MSAGGFIAQALLGGTQGASQGIGNKIREEAKLKRQQTLEGTRTENQKGLQENQSELAAGREAEQRDYDSEQAKQRREHELAMADKQHGQRKDLADYKLNTELELARDQAEKSGDLNDWQNANLDRINGSIDNLQKMERDLMTGKSDGMQISLMGEEGGEEPQNTSDKLAVIRQRLKAEEIKFNRVLGNQKGVDAGMAVLTQAANVTGDEDKQEFLSEFKKSRAYSEDLEREVMAVWDSKDKPSQEVEAPEASSRPGEDTVLAPDPQGGNQQAPQDQPQGGMISQANAGQDTPPKPDPKPERQPATEDVDMSPSNNSAQTLQQQIVERSRSEGKENYQKQAKAAQREVENLLVSGNLSSMDKNQRASTLRKYGEYIKAMPTEVIEQLKAAFGDQAIDQYLN